MGGKKQATKSNPKVTGTQRPQIVRAGSLSIRFERESIAKAYLRIRQEILSRSGLSEA